jgi:nitroreductase
MDHNRLSMTLGEAIFTQRSIRRFRPDPIPIPDIRLILEAAVRAPNGGNQQVARFLVVHDPKTIREFGELYHECRSVCGGAGSAHAPASDGGPGRKCLRRLGLTFMQS